MSIGLFGRLFGGLVGGLVFGLIAGLGIGLLNYGGEAFLKHFILRFFLQRRGVMPWPWQYVPFLDYAAGCILLQKDGPGYRFHHKLLQQHFAAMYQPDRA